MSEVAAIPEQRLSVLDQTHRALGASMGDRNGWVVPLSYGNVDDEYDAVRTGGAGLIDLSSRARINVSGSEAAQFLNGLITNDIKTLEEGMWMPAAFPNVQGRLLASVRVLHHSNGFLFDTEPAASEAVQKTLERFTMAGDFHVTDLTGTLAAITVQGPNASEIIERVLGTDAAQVNRGRLVETTWKEHVVTVIRASHTAEDGFDLFVAAPDAAFLWEELSIAGAEPVGLEALDILRTEAGLPVYGIDVDASNVVLEAGLDEAVSFTKGCYIGQEIIARIHWRGHVAKKIAGVILDKQAIIRPDDKLRSIEGKEIGRVTSTCVSPTLQRTISLCMVKYDYLAAGTPVIVISDNEEHTGQVAELPFVRGSWYEAGPDPVVKAT
jgi:folate-binding protein YgfZ